MEDSEKKERRRKARIEAAKPLAKEIREQKAALKRARARKVKAVAKRKALAKVMAERREKESWLGVEVRAAFRTLKALRSVRRAVMSAPPRS